MSDIDWSFVGVIIGVISIILAIVFGIRHAKKREKKEQSTPKMIQSVKQEVHIHQPKAKVKNSKKATKKPEIKWKILFDDLIVVSAGGYEALQFHLDGDDKIKGIANEIEKYEFNFYVMNEEEFSKYLNDEEFEFIQMDMDVSSTHINLTIPNEDVWYFVFDAYNKQYDREIDVELRLKSKG